MEIPKVQGHWLSGSFRPFQMAPQYFPALAAREHGGIARVRVFHRNLVCVNDPELFHQIMVKNHAYYERGFHYRSQHVLFGRGMISTDGPEWQRKRIRGAPAFNHAEIQKIFPATFDSTLRMFSTWDRAAETGQPVSLAPAMLELTIAVICKTLFSAEIDSEGALQFGLMIRDSMSLIRQKNNTFVRLPLWVPTRMHRQLIETRGRLTSFVLDKIAQRKNLKKSGVEIHDMLEVLLQGRDPDLVARDDPREFQEIIDECKTLLVAGFETTAFTLTWTLYLLSRHPEIAERWHQECDRIFASGDELKWQDLERMPYIRQIVMEAMRLYPVVYTLPRECVQDDVLGGYRVHKGDVLLLSVFGMHRSPEHWRNPDAFDPDRFADEGWPSKSYAPFGKGKHTCLGSNFGTFEMMLALALIGRRYSIKTNGPEVGMKCAFVLMPDRDIPLELRQRHSSSR
jgi:cytochrome P450